MSISERLQMVIKMNGMTNASFADEIGVQRSSISHVLAGRNKPSIDFIQKILTTFPKVNADWLITGKKIGRNTEQVNTMKTPEKDNKDLSDFTVAPTIKEEESAPYEGKTSPSSITASIGENKRRITKVLVFYNDGTFEETVAKH
ncbi:helix-turn-helix domain-containing protein [Brumimicrobium oceani]|uniref:Transcriptional regulator n=1 Tax=Brumimicrobium oceani TaxID=2100725 RepID=A0A2U2XHB2_9FLAO|nr:helix-turn-helix transcriptional regulator [Brumimicrobium oceani]PWH87101.1 transcriptional regulator [Brumimicrobium oceani]